MLFAARAGIQETISGIKGKQRKLRVVYFIYKLKGQYKLDIYLYIADENEYIMSRSFISTVMMASICDTDKKTEPIWLCFPQLIIRYVGNRYDKLIVVKNRKCGDFDVLCTNSKI